MYWKKERKIKNSNKCDSARARFLWGNDASDAGNPHWRSYWVGVLKSYQLYLTVCNRQSGKLVRFGNSTKTATQGGARRHVAGDGQCMGPPNSSGVAPDEAQEGRRPGFGSLFSGVESGGSGWGSAGDPRGIRSLFRGSGLFEGSKHISFGGILSDHSTLI